MNSIPLYDYQAEMVHAINAEMAHGHNVMVQMPTGTGKTFVMAAVIQQVITNGRIWVIAHRRELVEQMKDTLVRFGISYGDDYQQTGTCVMSIQWLGRHLAEIKEQVLPQLILIDEAHHSLAPTYQKLWTAFPKTYKIGFTATPCRLKATPFTALYDTLLTSWSIRQFICKGRLSLYDYVVISRDSEEQHAIDGLCRRGADGDYTISEMDEKLDVDTHIVRLFNSVEQYAHGKKGIVYAISIRHARHIADYYRSRGVRAVAIDSKTPVEERRKTVEDFKKGEIDCLVNVNLFDEGFDCPDVEYIQMARPTLSLSKYLQMVGRGLRTSPSKKMCVLIDNVGLYRLFGLPDADRDWPRMFTGEDPGRGRPQRDRKKRAGLHIVDNGMEVVANHSHLLPKTFGEEQDFMQNTVPFEKGGRWGLRSGDVIVLRPVYKMIKPFVGDYCAYAIAEGRWGVLSRKGLVVVSPDFMGVHMLNDGTALLEKGSLLTWRINLKNAEQEALETRAWWEKRNKVIKMMAEENRLLRNKRNMPK